MRRQSQVLAFSSTQTQQPHHLPLTHTVFSNSLQARSPVQIYFFRITTCLEASANGLVCYVPTAFRSIIAVLFSHNMKSRFSSKLIH